MKKSFLKGIVLVILFCSIFSISFYKGEVAFALVQKDPTDITWKTNGKEVRGKQWIMDSGRVLIVYKNPGDDEYTMDYYTDTKKTDKLIAGVKVDSPEAGLAKATIQDKKDINRQIDTLKAELSKRGLSTYERQQIQKKIDLLEGRKTQTIQQFDTAQRASEAGNEEDWVDNALQTMWLSVVLALSEFVSWVVSGAGWIYDKVLIHTTTYPTNLDNAIVNSWKIIRDLANIVIVFSLLYLGIKTILDGQGFADKKILIGVIIAAIFINFSLVFVKVTFEVSNTIGRQVLEQSKMNNTSSGNGNDSYSAAIMGIVKPQQVISAAGFGEGWGSAAIAVNSRTDWGLVMQMTGQLLLLGLVVIALAFIFLGVSATLLYRYFILLFLMIFSPIGLIGTQIPWLKKYGSQWFDQLKKQALYFPVFSFMLYITIYFVSLLATSTSLNLGSATSIFEFLFSFFLILGFLIGLLILPAKLGAAGSDLMTNAGNWATGKIKNIKNIPRSTAQFGGRMVASGTARTGRYLIGDKLANRIGGNTDEKRKALQEKARSGNFFERNIARNRLKASESLKEKTYDIRNIDAVKNSKFGKGMGQGIDTYTNAIKQKQTEYEDRKKKEMKLYGYDTLHETDEAKLNIKKLEVKARNAKKSHKDAKDAYDMNPNDVTLSELKKAEKHLKDRELALGEAKNIGSVQHLEHDSKRFVKKVERFFSPLSRKTLEKIKDEHKKKWIASGESKGKREEKAKDQKLEKDLSNTPARTTSSSPDKK